MRMQWLDYRSYWILVMLAGCAALAGCPTNNYSPMGTNLDEVSDWSNDLPFIDVFKTSRPWISGELYVWEDGRTLDLDENGWVRSLQPGQIAHTLMFRTGPIYPAGQYHVLYDGEGVMTYRFAASKNEALSAPGHHVVDVDPTIEGGINLQILDTNPANYIRNIRVIVPGAVLASDPFVFVEDPSALPEGDAIPLWQAADTQIFHPLFLARMRRYSTVRFMDWMHTNWSPIQHWSEWAQPEDAQWTSDGGIPVEIMCALANRLEADPWFTIPHLANDSFVAEFAGRVRDNLDPGRRAYIEYSNEVWNGGFGQAIYAQQQGADLGLPGTTFEKGMRFYSRRSVEIFQIFEQVFNGTSRLVRVLASQAANTGVSPLVLDFEGAYQYTDALAIAPYFGYELGLEGNVSETLAMSLDELFAHIETVDLPQSYQWMSSQAAVANTYGVQLVAYEGGQHLVGVGGARENSALNALFNAANRDPRMGALYAEYLRVWRNHTNGPFCHFTHCGSYSKWGRWGSLEYWNQPIDEAPKYKAIQDFINEVQSAENQAAYAASIN